MILEDFQGLTAPRIERAKRRNLPDIVTLTLGAAPWGADQRGELPGLAKTRPRGYGVFLALPNGIPDPGCRGRVFRRRDPEQFQAGFPAWVRSVSQRIQGK